MMKFSGGRVLDGGFGGGKASHTPSHRHLHPYRFERAPGGTALGFSESISGVYASAIANCGWRWSADNRKRTTP